MYKPIKDKESWSVSEKVKELMSKIQEGEAKKVGYITIQIFLMIANGERYFCSLIPSTREN